MTKKQNTVVLIDIGRGRTKAKVAGRPGNIIFPSVHSFGYEVDLNAKANRLHVEIDNLSELSNGEWFVGEYALESQTASEYSTDSKTDQNAQILFATALSALELKTGSIKVVIGVPKSMYTQSVLDEVRECYQDKKITLINKVTEKTQIIHIEDINIYPEGNAAALYQVSLDPSLEENWFAMINIGFNTLEWSVFAPGIEYHEGSSRSIPFGNRDIIAQVQAQLKSNLSHQQIDSDKTKRIKDALTAAYARNKNNVESRIKSVWRTNREDMRVFCCGGTVQHMQLDYEYTPDGQFATLYGLEIVGLDIYE